MSDDAIGINEIKAAHERIAPYIHRTPVLTSKTLDDWVEAGAVRSRSEGAALFIREGLKVRAEELGQLRDALADVESARRRLREKAKEILDADIKQEGDNDK